MTCRPGWRTLAVWALCSTPPRSGLWKRCTTRTTSTATTTAATVNANVSTGLICSLVGSAALLSQAAASWAPWATRLPPVSSFWNLATSGCMEGKHLERATAWCGPRPWLCSMARAWLWGPMRSRLWLLRRRPLRQTLGGRDARGSARSRQPARTPVLMRRQQGQQGSATAKMQPRRGPSRRRTAAATATAAV